MNTTPQHKKKQRPEINGELPKTYSAKDFEETIYQEWEKSGTFIPKINIKKKPFSIALPPPNATGELHLGHAIMLAISDIMIRFHRMKGDPTLWLPGTDHAAIATQNRVEKIIATEGETRQSLGRKKFLKRVHAYVENSQDVIRNQMRKMGASVDWTRERYTMDEGLSHAVNTAFVRMFKDGLIYRGHRIVNWCVRCQSTLADDEVQYREEKVKFYYLKYGPFIIGTARPETKFLDKIIVVHPSDKRYKKWIGKEVMVPWIDGEVRAKILADEEVDPDFGTGAMTITPAHDFKDFEIAQRNPEIEIIQIIDEKGNLTEYAGEFKGMNAREAREKIIDKLEQKGLVEKTEEDYVHNLSVCYRCETPIEPLISQQWFINVNKKVNGKSLKERSIEVVRKKKITIIPERFDKTYFHWMENLRDWCISRQIWWGHQIPVWYCKTPKKEGCANPIVREKTPIQCPSCKGTKLEQDPDTLDTWFSSGLWTFSTLGWPKKTKELDYFHPTSVLETGHDILFFWVARMIVLTTYLLEEVPFKTVYLHGLVLDKEGQKMSKSLGNGINPLDMIEKYGTDAVRLSLVLGSSPGNNMRLYEEKIAGYRNFVNKIWNGARFVLMNMEKGDFALKINPKSLTLADEWILERTQELIAQATKGIEEYRFSEVGLLIYDFFWREYCDWYLEMSKINPNKPVLLYVLKTLLALLHPFTPFVTEALWGKMHIPEKLITSAWPKPNKKFAFKTAKRKMEAVIQVISMIRQARSEYKIEPAKKISATLYGGEFTSVLQANENILKTLARLEKIEIQKEGKKIKQAIAQLAGSIEIYIPLTGLMDVEQEKNRINKELLSTETYLKGLTQKLSNAGYVKNAPPAIVAQDEERKKEVAAKIKQLKEQIKSLH